MSGEVRRPGGVPAARGRTPRGIHGRLARFSVGLLAVGCATLSPLPPAAEEAGPVRAAERFLDAANRQDLDALAHAFGTHRGPIAEAGGGLGCGLQRLASWLGVGNRCSTRQEVEVRMHAIAAVLRHDGYEVASAEQVPGRDRPVTRVSVEVRRGERVHPDVGLLVVRTSSGWLVESVELEKITGR